MKAYELKAVTYAKRFTSSWDYWCLAKDAYLEGYQQAGKDFIDSSIHPDAEVSVSNETQLSPETFKKWEKENKELSFDVALRAYMRYYDFNDLRFHKDENGVVSFQGTCKLKE